MLVNGILSVLGALATTLGVDGLKRAGLDLVKELPVQRAIRKTDEEFHALGIEGVALLLEEWLRTDVFQRRLQLMMSGSLQAPGEDAALATACADRAAALMSGVRGVEPTEVLAHLVQNLENEAIRREGGKGRIALARLIEDRIAAAGARPAHSPAEDHLGLMDQLSALGLEDAGLVVAESANPEGRRFSLADGLYVTRGVEKKILDRLTGGSEEGAPIFIVGEAGFGKTSLLWNLHRSLSRDKTLRPWFVKANLLATLAGRADSAGSLVDARLLLDATAAAQRDGLRPVILLDTIDLLLHRDADRTLVRYLLDSLREARCPVVATCRPRESATLQIRDARHFILGLYDVPEMKQAVEGHLSVFCRHLDRGERDRQMDRLRRAVAQGKPVQSICRMPLALRMMFELYRPSEIPEEINIHGLYRAFWDLRILVDRRAGDGALPFDHQDLSRAAEAIAIVMLAEGSPVAGIGAVTVMLRQWGIDPDEVEKLGRRNVLRNDGRRSWHFFHQSFFEYSAARGLANRFLERAPLLVASELRRRPNDAFLNPILEQVVLTCADGTRAMQEAAFRALTGLLEGPEHGAVWSSLYVYCHLDAPDEQLQEAARHVLAGCDAKLAAKYVELTANTGRARFDGLAVEYGILWDRNVAAIREHVLAGLARMSETAPELVRSFLVDRRVMEYVDSLPVNNAERLKLTEVLARLAPACPDWCWGALAQTYEQQARKSPKREIQCRILAALAECADAFPWPDLAEKFEAETACVYDAKMSGYRELCMAMGGLWVHQWRKQGQDLSQIWSQALETTSEFSFQGRLNGIALLAETFTLDAWRDLIAGYAALPDANRQWVFAHVVLPVVLDLPAAVDGEVTLDPGRRDVALAVARLLAEAVENAGESRGQILEEQVSRAAGASRLRRAVFMQLFGASRHLVVDYWLTRQTASLAVAGFLAGHPAATAAVERLVAADTPADEHVRKAVKLTLERHLDREEAYRALLAMALYEGDCKRILGILQSNTAAAREWTVTHGDALRGIRDRVMASPQNLLGLRLWIHLVEEGVEPPASEVRLCSFLDRWRDPGLQARVCDLARVGADRGTRYGGDLLTRLERLAARGFEALSDSAVGALAAGAVGPEGDESYRETAVAGALSPPSHAGRIALLDRILIDLADRGRFETALEILSRVLLSPVVRGMGGQAKHNIADGLGPSLLDIAKIADREGLRSLLQLARATDPHIGRGIVRAVCKVAIAPAAEELDAIMADEAASGVLKQTVSTYRYHHERILGGQGWPELYDLCERRDPA